MNIRPKTIRRLAALLLVCLLVAGSLTGIWAYHQHAKTKQLFADRDFGINALRAGDYPLAIERLRIYKDQYPDDYEATYAYASARLREPSPPGQSGRNISEAKQLFEQLNRVRPEDQNVSHVLLDLYTNFSLFPEALRLSDAVLAHNPRDAAALYGRAVALQGSGKTDEALAAAERLNEVEPDSFRGHRLTIGLLHNLRRPPDEVL